MRIGIHAGEVLSGADGLLGREVHRAARIGSLAVGDEITSSAETAALLGPGFVVGDSRLEHLAGITGPVEIVTIRW